MNAEFAGPDLISRPVRSDDDFWLVRKLLVDTYTVTPPDWNWDIRRWDGSFFHNEKPGWDARFGEDGRFLHIWETVDGQVVGAVHPEGSGIAYIQLDPDFRFLEKEMLQWAEENLSVPCKEGPGKFLKIFIYEYDSLRFGLAKSRGYEKLSEGGVIRHLRFGKRPFPHPAIAEGYLLRTTRMDDDAECQGIADLFNAAFRRTIHTAREIRTFMENSPSYRNDLDLVAEAPDGSIAALVGLIYEETHRFGLFEPVCTHPDHLRKGLAGTLMYEGLHRVRALGATDTYVGTGDMAPANALYESVGFNEVYKGYYWRKIF